MAFFASRKATVTSVRNGPYGNTYRLDIDDGFWNWTDEFLVPASSATNDHYKHLLQGRY